MSFEVFEKLEAKVQAAVDTISLLQMELEELRGQNEHLRQENEHMRNENDHMRNEHNHWQERLHALLGKIEQVEENV
ncbi:cell division protein ZapB [Dongshaea marina]|uniref:cell division protein ZapB n=1 Tax=Dongshaea marina TaxID=2047966 RepID=UPI000D3EB8D5|nr:cell division protein ZapB [Dongshaea marina]